MTISYRQTLARPSCGTAATMKLERQFLDHLAAVEQFGFMMGKLALLSAEETLLFEAMIEADVRR